MRGDEGCWALIRRNQDGSWSSAIYLLHFSTSNHGSRGNALCSSPSAVTAQRWRLDLFEGTLGPGSDLCFPASSQASPSAIPTLLVNKHDDASSWEIARPQGAKLPSQRPPNKVSLLAQPPLRQELRQAPKPLAGGPSLHNKPQLMVGSPLICVSFR